MARNAFADRSVVSDTFLSELFDHRVSRSRILIVTDGAIAVTPFPDPPEISYEFGISGVIAMLKAYSTPTVAFEVTVATRNGAANQPRTGYDLSGFRFDAAALSTWDQIWLFGYNPGNLKPNSVDPADDALIVDPAANALSEEEIAALADWMEAGGNVFAVGDHHLLGASMCFRVPRVSLMRHWAIAQGVTTRDGKTRLETDRPATVRQFAGHDPIPKDNEHDAVPQRIEWVPDMRRADGPASGQARPHPLLCHPTLGPIDILPDHLHEGRCHVFDNAWQHQFGNADYIVRGEWRPHFPLGTNGLELPKVIAWGQTLAAPPLQFEQGNQPANRFPMIAVYDGRAVNIGRVVVDSTWHHWFDLNMSGIVQAAQATGVTRELELIRRYHLNVALWLSRPDWRLTQLHAMIKALQFGYFGQEIFNPRGSARATGHDIAQFLGQALGPCWVTESVLDQVHDLDPELAVALRDALGADADPDLPAHALVFAALGGVVHALYSDMDELRSQLRDTGQVQRSPLRAALRRHARAGALAGLKEEMKTWREKIDAMARSHSQFSGLFSKQAQ